jgi:hypothetical protein
MMFIVRSRGEKPDAALVQIKATRRTPEIVPGGAGKTDHFCIGEAEAIAVLRAEGWEVVELRDGWYADDAGGGVAISGHGRYWELRDTPFTVKERVGPGGESVRAGDAEKGEHVNVRGAVFGV